MKTPDDSDDDDVGDDGDDEDFDGTPRLILTVPVWFCNATICRLRL